jgi:NADPH:quinone reductase-like Zn-dependent oxidoreductase
VHVTTLTSPGFTGATEEEGMTDADATTTVTAVEHTRYGAPASVLELREIVRPAVNDDGLLVRVRAASINPADWYGVAGRPWIARPMMGGIRRPRSGEVGADVAGVVEAVGKDVTHFAIGDEVLARSGAFAEVVCVREARAAHKPATVTFEDAAGVPVAGVTALQGLRDHGQVVPGKKVLVNGASGGVGTFAVQIAKVLGAEVTAVCSRGNVEQARALGADHVVDYTREDFTRSHERYDVLFDVAGSRSWRECKRVLTPDATLVVVGAPKGTRLLGPLSHIAGMKLASVRSSRKVIWFIAKLEREDLALLGTMLESGEVVTVVDRRFALDEVADAFRYLEEGHARGKIVLTL